MISIDTDLMKQLVSASSAANAEIDKAAASLNRVATHYDWECREKVIINNFTEQNKKTARRLQENSRSFLNTLTGVAAEFENSENSINNMFPGLEAIIGSVAAVIGTSQSPIFPASKIQKMIKEASKIFQVDSWNEKITNYEIENFDSPIAICRFSDFDLNGGAD